VVEDAKVAKVEPLTVVEKVDGKVTEVMTIEPVPIKRRTWKNSGGKVTEGMMEEPKKP
jgi:hypothetical protein